MIYKLVKLSKLMMLIVNIILMDTVHFLTNKNIAGDCEQGKQNSILKMYLCYSRNVLEIVTIRSKERIVCPFYLCRKPVHWFKSMHVYPLSIVLISTCMADIVCPMLGTSRDHSAGVPAQYNVLFPKCR